MLFYANICLLDHAFFALQVSGLSRSHQTQSQEAAFKTSSSLRHFFTPWKTTQRSNSIISTDSAAEDKCFNNPKEGIEGSGHIQVPLHSAMESTNPDKILYEAESPDEAALVYAARAYGFTLVGRSPDSVTVRLPSGENLMFEVLDTLAFDYTRKRMSILVRHPITRECVLYTKGADYAIMELLGAPYAGVCRGTSQHFSAVAPITSRRLRLTCRTSQRESEERSC